MNSWGSAPSSSTVWGTGPQSAPAWPPYKLPSDYLPSSSTSVQQAQCTPRMSLPSVQDLHGARPQVPQHKTLQQNTPQLLLSSSNHAAVMQSALTTTPQHSAAVTYQAPYSVNNQPHGGMPLECYYTAHLQYPKTWVHLWDRLPLREPETLISSSYKLDMFVHTSAIQTLRDVASGSTQSAPMLAVCCEESADGCIRLAVYNDTYEGEANEKPLKVDTFVTVKKALPPPNQQDDVATVSSLASAFQAACNTSSLPRLCHLLPMELTAALCNPTQLLYPPPAGEPAPRSGPSVQLSGIVLQPNVSVSLTQLHRMKVLQCMLSARLMHGVAEDEDERFRSGLLSIEQSRSLVPLLYADPMVNQAPLVGIWVTGISSITNSLVLSAALAFHTSNAKRTKAIAPDGSFLVLAFKSQSTQVPEVYEACLSSPRGVPLMPFSVTAEVPAPTDPLYRSISSSPTPDSRALRNLSKALLIERPHLLYSLFVDHGAQATASALATVSVPGGTASASMPKPATHSAQHFATRESAASLSAWRQDTAHHQNTHVNNTGTSSEVRSPYPNPSVRGMPCRWHSTLPASPLIRGDPQCTTAPHAPSRSYVLQEAMVPLQGSQGAGIHMGGPAAGVPRTATSTTSAPQTGVPPVPSPSPLVSKSMTPLQGQAQATHHLNAKTPALGLPDRGTLHSLPGAAVTGPGPLSAGSMAFAPSTAQTMQSARPYCALFDQHQAGAVAPALQQPQQQLQMQPSTHNPATVQESAEATLHSNMHALFVGSAPVQGATADPNTSDPYLSASQPHASHVPQVANNSLHSAAIADPSSAMGSFQGNVAAANAVGVPEWLAGAVQRHPDLAPLLRDQAAVVAREGSVTAETPAGSATSVAPGSVTGEIMLGGHAGNAGDHSHTQVAHLQVAGGHNVAAPAEHAALAELLNASIAPSAAASDVYSHLIAPEPDARDLASTRRTSFSDDPSINGSVTHGAFVASCAPGDSATVQEEPAVAVGYPMNGNPGQQTADTGFPSHGIHSSNDFSAHQFTGIENQAPKIPPAAPHSAFLPQQQQAGTVPEHSTQMSQDWGHAGLKPVQSASTGCTQAGPSTPRTKRATCEAQSSSKKQKLSPPQPSASSPVRPLPGNSQHHSTHTAAHEQMRASDLVQVNNTNPASSLAQLPVPVLPVSATQDPETASALAPLYDYIGKLRQHIALLQEQVCHLSGRVTNRDSVQAVADQCSQSLSALNISDAAAATQAPQQQAGYSACPPDQGATGSNNNAQCPTQASPGNDAPQPSAQDSLPACHAPNADSGAPLQQAHGSVLNRNESSAAPVSSSDLLQAQVAARDLHRRSTADPAKASGGDQNDALEAIVDAFLVSSAGGVSDSLPGQSMATGDVRKSISHLRNSMHGQRELSDSVRQQSESRCSQERVPLSPRSMNVPGMLSHAGTAHRQEPSAHRNTMQTPTASTMRHRIGDRGSAALSECQSSAERPHWGGSLRADAAALAASRDGSSHSVRTPTPAEVQESRQTRDRQGSGTTCLSPELAALIRDAEHVSGQDYEESLCLREETSMSEANASSRHRSSNGEAAQDPDADVRRSRRKHRGSDAEDAHEQHQSERNDTRALIVAASAQAKRHKNISERSKELMMRAKHSTRQYSGDATAARYNQKTDPPLRHTKHRGSARPAYSSGRAYSGRRSVVSHDTDEFDDTGLSFVPTPTSAPRIQLPSNAAGKKAMKTLMKHKELKKIIRNSDLMENGSPDSNEEETSTSLSDEEQMARLEKKYGLKT